LPLVLFTMLSPCEARANCSLTDANLYDGADGAEAPKIGRDRCAEEAQTILRLVASPKLGEGLSPPSLCAVVQVRIGCNFAAV
jgi:hypothetical protein